MLFWDNQTANNGALHPNHRWFESLMTGHISYLAVFSGLFNQSNIIHQRYRKKGSQMKAARYCILDGYAVLTIFYLYSNITHQILPMLANAEVGWGAQKAFS